MTLKPRRDLGRALGQNLALLRQEVRQRAHVLVVENEDRRTLHATTTSTRPRELRGACTIVRFLFTFYRGLRFFVVRLVLVLVLLLQRGGRARFSEHRGTIRRLPFVHDQDVSHHVTVELEQALVLGECIRRGRELSDDVVAGRQLVDRISELAGAPVVDRGDLPTFGGHQLMEPLELGGDGVF